MLLHASIKTLTKMDQGKKTMYSKTFAKKKNVGQHETFI